MNREMRRAQAKADKKQEEAKEKVKAERVLKKQRRMDRVKAKPKQANTSKDATTVSTDPKKLPGRWSGIFAIFTTIFIILQSVLPTNPTGNDMFSFAINVLYYFMFAYFVYLFSARAGRANALNLTVLVGSALTLGLIAAQFFIPGVTPEIRLAFFAIPGVILGSLMGQLVFTRAP